MTGISSFPKNPVELAAGLSAVMSIGETRPHITTTDKYNLEQLTVMAGALGFVGMQYSLEVSKCISAPPDHSAGISALPYGRPIRFGELAFVGGFNAFAKIISGKPGEKRAIGSWCLLFEEVALLPEMMALPPGHVLCVRFGNVNKIRPLCNI